MTRGGPDAQEAGFYDLRFVGRTADGQAIEMRVTGDRDPGYGPTSKILGDAAVCLLGHVREDLPGGFWTPARPSAMCRSSGSWRRRGSSSR